MERVDRLEGTVSAMEGELAVIRNMNTLFSRQLDEADSCSRRAKTSYSHGCRARNIRAALP